MKKNEHILASESVAEGHPDKICDQISDAILDEFIGSDPNCKTAIETMVTPNSVFIAGEVRSKSLLSDTQVDFIARNQLNEIGYDGDDGFSWKTVNVVNSLHKQSDEIAKAVDESLNHAEGAGDQGTMVGHACSETNELMPMPIMMAHKIMHGLIQDAKGGFLKGLKTDAKCQVAIKYQDGMPVAIDNLVISIQHAASLKSKEVYTMVSEWLSKKLPYDLDRKNCKLLINPSGSFVKGGPESDTGLTGRKIVVDTYGSIVPHGGGAFSGKDPSKVDRSAAYMARYLAKNIVASNLASKCTIFLSYAIGIPEPLAINVDTHGTGNLPDSEIALRLPKLVDLTPRGIRKHLSLDRPIYKITSAYGHFGREPSLDNSFSWERLDLKDKIIKMF